jgi:peptide-methionine (S)-S-oxide reductase
MSGMQKIRRIAAGRTSGRTGKRLSGKGILPVEIWTMKQTIYLLLAASALNFSAPAQTNSMNTTHKTEIADLGGGCFWCMEAVFERLPGVISVTSGFAGGTTENPTYQQVCTETTGHAEVTEIEFDPAKISYQKLLEVFWQAHDPTTLNRQGADEGTSYRSIILYRDGKQKLFAEKSKLEAQQNFKHPIVTEIVPLKKFYKAEDYHQEYYDNNSNAPYCQVVIAPKLEKLEKKKVIQETPQTTK